MFKMYCMILLFGHVLGDFYLQTNTMAAKKASSMKWVLIHSGSYLAVMVSSAILLACFEMLPAAIIVSLLHAMIDIGKYIYLQYKKNACQKTLRVERNVFLLDQLLHVFCIVLVSCCFIQHANIIHWSWMRTLSKISNISIEALLYWIVALLLIHKPANILIQKLLTLYKVKSSDKTMIKRDPNAGRLIGSLERLIMLMFLSIGQYAAIGLVLTAKSIARYDRIAKEQDFAEYYLLGTLLSTAIVLSTSFLL